MSEQQAASALASRRVCVWPFGAKVPQTLFLVNIEQPQTNWGPSLRCHVGDGRDDDVGAPVSAEGERT